MKFLAALVVLIAIIGAIVLPQIFYIVDETQLAIVTRFGEPRGFHYIAGPVCEDTLC